MAKEKINAMTVVSRDGQDVELKAGIEYDLGESLEEAKDLFGEEVVYNMYKAQARISAQAQMRKLLVAGKSEEEIQSEMDKWVLGQTIGVQKDKYAAVVDDFKNKSPEEQAAFIQKLQEMLAGQAA